MAEEVVVLVCPTFTSTLNSTFTSFSLITSDFHLYHPISLNSFNLPYISPPLVSLSYSIMTLHSENPPLVSFPFYIFFVFPTPFWLVFLISLLRLLSSLLLAYLSTPEALHLLFSLHFKPSSLLPSYPILQPSCTSLLTCSLQFFPRSSSSFLSALTLVRLAHPTRYLAFLHISVILTHHLRIASSRPAI